MAIAAMAMIAGLLAFLPSTAAAAQANEITVSAGESIQAALDAADPGTTITVEKGTYEEALVIRTSGITLIGEKGATVSPGDARSECEFFGDIDAICIANGFFVNEAGQTDSTETIRDVTVSGFTIKNVRGAGVGVVRGENITITRNSVQAPGCDGFYVITTTGFEVSRNTTKKASNVLGFCNGLSIINSSDGIVSRNKALNGFGTGVMLNSVESVNLDRNKVVGNCNGITLTDGPDAPLGVKNVKITKNTVSKNNKTCKPFESFGFDESFGGAGIAVLGGDKIQIKKNKVTKNIVDDKIGFPTAGIMVLDNVNIFTGEFIDSVGRVSISRNTVTKNSVNGLETDILVGTEDGKVNVTKNNCGVSTPDPAWCGG